jgi:transcriptional regulator with XRE-family HTH domain
MKTFGERLKFLREEKGLSIRKLALQVGISDRNIGMWEKGIVQPILETLFILCRFFNVDMNYLTGWSES